MNEIIHADCLNYMKIIKDWLCLAWPVVFIPGYGMG